MVIKLPQLTVPKNSVPLGGLYVISPEPPEKHPTLFKIGKSINLKRRLNSYHICFPQGFYIYTLLIAKTAKNRQKRIDEVGSLETSLFRIIKARSASHHKKYLSGAREMFDLKPNDMRDVFAELHRKKSDIIQTLDINPLSSIAHIEAKDFLIPDEGKTTRENLMAVNLIDKETKKKEKFEKKYPERAPKRVQPKRTVRDSIESRYNKIVQKYLEMGLY